MNGILSLLGNQIFLSIYLGNLFLENNQKYLEWIARDYMNSVAQNDLYLEMVLDAVKTFDRKRNNLKVKDLYSYDSYTDLNDALNNLKIIYKSAYIYVDQQLFFT